MEHQNLREGKDRALREVHPLHKGSLVTWVEVTQVAQPQYVAKKLILFAQP